MEERGLAQIKENQKRCNIMFSMLKIMVEICLPDLFVSAKWGWLILMVTEET